MESERKWIIECNREKVIESITWDAKFQICHLCNALLDYDYEDKPCDDQRLEIKATPYERRYQYSQIKHKFISAWGAYQYAVSRTSSWANLIWSRWAPFTSASSSVDRLLCSMILCMAYSMILYMAYPSYPLQWGENRSRSSRLSRKFCSLNFNT